MSCWGTAKTENWHKDKMDAIYETTRSSAVLPVGWAEQTAPANSGSIAKRAGKRASM